MAVAVGIAEAYYSQRHVIADDRETLQRLISTVGRTGDLFPYQWAQWYATTLEFQPTLILELGRGYGNSTAMFCQAVSRLGKGTIVSLCLSIDWDNSTRQRLRNWLPDDWFGPLDARTVDIRAVDFESLLSGQERVLVLWDAHGFEIAEVVLGTILPLLVHRPHLVLMHDIMDTRYMDKSTSAYGPNPLWKGAAWQERSKSFGSRVRLGWMESNQDQVIALADFTSRNEIELDSADHAYHTYFGSDEAKRHEMLAAIGAEMFSTIAHWAFLTLPDDGRLIHFPPKEPLVDAPLPRRSRWRRKLARMLDTVS